MEEIQTSISAALNRLFVLAQYGVALLIDLRPNSLHLYPEILCRVVQADLTEIIYSEISRETSSLYAGLEVFCLFEARPQNIDYVYPSRERGCVSDA
jgi:hypothetical protein